MILRVETDGRAVRVWAVAKADEAKFNKFRDPCYEFYFHDGKWDEARVEALIAERKAAAAIEAKRAAVDSAIDAEVQKRKAAVDYAKPPADAVAAVFPTAIAEGVR